MSSAVPLELIVFLSACFTGALVAGVAGFAFGLIASAIWLHVIAPAQSAALIAAFAIIIQGASLWKLRHAHCNLCRGPMLQCSRCRVTRPGDAIAAATWDTRGGFVVLRMILDAAAMLDQNAREASGGLHQAHEPPWRLGARLARRRPENVVQDTVTIRMDFASFTDFWTPMEGKEGPVAEYIGSISAEARAMLREAVALAYLDGEHDGPRSYAATAWVVKGKVPCV